MVDIETLRPLLEDSVEEIALLHENKTIRAGDKLEWRVDKPGFIKGAYCSVSSQNAVLEQNLWDQIIKITLSTANTLTTVGIVNPQCAWLEKYNEAGSVFSLGYAPRPYPYYKKGSYIKLTAPASETITAYYFYVYYIEIKDMTKFKKLLKELLGKE